MILPIFPKNCMKLKNVGGFSWIFLDPPLLFIVHAKSQDKQEIVGGGVGGWIKVLKITATLLCT